MAHTGQEAATARPPGLGLPLRRGESAVRFLAVSMAAFVVDFTIAVVLRHSFHMKLWLAAGIAFAIIALPSYLVHEHWTFAHATSRASADRMGRTVLASAVSLGVRIGTIYLLELLREPSDFRAVVYFAIAAGLSLLTNYALNRFWVFDRRGQG